MSGFILAMIAAMPISPAMIEAGRDVEAAYAAEAAADCIAVSAALLDFLPADDRRAFPIRSHATTQIDLWGYELAAAIPDTDEVVLSSEVDGAADRLDDEVAAVKEAEDWNALLRIYAGKLRGCDRQLETTYGDNPHPAVNIARTLEDGKLTE